MGFFEVLTEHHERPSQEEKNEKRYFAFPMIKNPKQRHIQRPRGRWLVMADIGMETFFQRLIHGLSLQYDVLVPFG